jgi:hypothetical protein
VWGVGLRRSELTVHELGFTDYGLGLWVVGFRVYDLWFRVMSCLV